MIVFFKQTIILSSLIICFLLAAGPGMAQTPSDDILDQVGFDQRLNEQVPLDLVFQDESGEAIALGSLFTNQPVILVIGYYECPMLCSFVREGLFERLQELEFSVGRDFSVINVSIDPHETPHLASITRTMYIQEYGRDGSSDGWHFLTGTEAAIQQLAAATGFRYAYDEHIQQYAHPAGIIILTPTGRISRYLYGIEFAARDLRLGLVEASANRIGTPIDQVLLRCYHYDPVKGKYSFAIVRVLQVAGVTTVLGLTGLVGMMLRRDRRKAGPSGR